MRRLNDFLTEARVFYLATADGNQPKVFMFVTFQVSLFTSRFWQSLHL